MESASGIHTNTYANGFDPSRPMYQRTPAPPAVSVASAPIGERYGMGRVLTIMAVVVVLALIVFTVYTVMRSQSLQDDVDELQRRLDKTTEQKTSLLAVPTMQQIEDMAPAPVELSPETDDFESLDMSGYLKMVQDDDFQPLLREVANNSAAMRFPMEGRDMEEVLEDRLRYE